MNTVVDGLQVDAYGNAEIVTGLRTARYAFFVAANQKSGKTLLSYCLISFTAVAVG